MDVYIKCSCGWWPVHVNPEDTIENVKCKIETQYPFRRYVRYETGLPFLLCRIWNILISSIFPTYHQFSRPAIELSVVTATCKIIRVAVDVHSKILDLKQEIARSEGFAVSRQILRVGNEVMQDEKTLREYGIEEHAVLWLEFQSSKVCCVLLERVASFVLGIGVFLQAYLFVLLHQVIERICDLLI